MLRHRCTPAERIFCITNEHLGGQGNPCSVIRCRGRLDQARVLKALAGLQRRHAKLRCRIENDKSQWPWFVEMDPLVPIPCEFREAQTETEIQHILFHGWSGQFPPDQGPLLKLVVVYTSDSDVTDVIGWFHHCIFDAGSVSLFFREFLQLYADPQACSTPAAGGFEAEIAGRRGLLGDIRWWSRLIWHRGIMRSIFPAVKLPDVSPVHESYIRKILSPERSQQLTKACRDRGASVTGALSAAGAIVLSRLYGWKKGRLAFQLPRNARPEFAPPIESDTLGVFATVYDVLVPLLPAETPFWDVARRHSEEITGQFEWKDPVRGLRLIKHVPIKALMKQDGHDTALVINNQGRVSFPQADGLPEVLDYYGHARNATIPCVTITTVTFNDRLALSLDSQFVDQQTVNQLFHEILDILDAALEAPSPALPAATDKPVLV